MIRLATTLAFVCPALAIAQPCSPYWIGLDARVSTLNRPPDQMAVWDDGTGPKLYVTGSLVATSGSNTRGVVTWDGDEWQTVNHGYQQSDQAGYLRTLHDGIDHRLYVTGYRSGGQGWWTRYWNGSAWVEGPPGFLVNNHVYPYLTLEYPSGPETYGTRWTALWQRHDVVRWNGASWDTIGSTPGMIYSVAEFDDGSGPQLHIAGSFTSINGIPAQRAAKWTGTTWEPLGTGLGPTTVMHMISHDDGTGPALYLCNVRSAGGQQINHIARWDGQNWSNVGGGIQDVGITTVRVLASFDDGTGPALFAGGYMQMAGGVPVRSIARFKDGVWDDMGGGVRGGIPHAMTVYDDGRGPSLFVAGAFHTVGSGADGAAPMVAQWVGCHNQCYADCNNDQTLNVDDFICFINKFSRGDPYADCNQDGVRDVNDFVCFVNRFAENCR